MKKFLYVLLIFITCSCSTSHYSIIEYKTYIEAFVTAYQNENCYYPESIDDFILFSESVLPLADSASMDVLQMTLNEIKKQKNQIAWIVVDENLLYKELFVLYKNDTLAKKKFSAFPTLHRLIDAYQYCYCQCPKSYKAFRKHYLAMVNEKDTWPTKKCDSITMLGLEKCQSIGMLSWSLDDDGLSVSIGNDTLGFWGNYSYCDYSILDAFEFQTRFFDNDSIGFTSEILEQQFKMGLRGLRSKFSTTVGGGADGWYLLKYSKKEGIVSFCEEDTIDLNTRWFFLLKQYVDCFSEDNGLNSIVFVTPAME